MSRPSLVGIGRVGVAFTGRTDELPELGPGGASAEVDAWTLSLGTGTALALATAAALGCAVRIAGVQGNDVLGGWARAALGKAGVDVEHLRAAGASSPCTMYALAGGGRRLVLTGAGDAEVPAAIFAWPTVLAGAGALLVDGSCVALQVAAAEAARARKIPVIVDGSAATDGVAELVGLADVLISSERLAAELAPRGELAATLAGLRALGPRAVVITLGGAGAIGLHDDRVVECPAFPVEVADPTGAGSVFHGGFAAGLLGGLPFARCLELAAAAAALSCRAAGPWAGIPSRDEVIALSKTRH